MRHNSFIALSTLAIFVLLLSACNKDGDPKPNSGGDLYIASPEKLMDMAGKDWDALKPDLDNKKGYWYTPFTEEANLAVKAAVSLPALEETNHGIGYSIMLNISRQYNNDAGPLMGTDTATRLSFSDATSVMLEYYNRSLPLCSDTLFTYAQYAEPGGLNGLGIHKTSVANVVAMMTNGTAADQYHIQLSGAHKGFTAHVQRNDDGNGYWFSFQSFAY